MHGVPIDVASGVVAPVPGRIVVAVWAGLALALLAVYAPIAGHGFVNFDDPMYLYDNGHVTAGLTADGARWAFTNKDALQWQPLTWLGHQTVYELFGGRPGAHLLVNLALHWLTAGLLWHLLARTTGSATRSFAVALLFALHPVNVETVAWASQLKSTLSTACLLATLGAYVDYARTRRRGSYALACFFLVLGLLAKPMLVSVPLVLLLLDAWPLRRAPWNRAGLGWRPWLAEKIPFVLFALAGVVVNALPWGSHADLPTVARVGPARLFHALANTAVYLRKWILPIDLGVLYPERADWPAGAALAGAALILVFTAWAWRSRVMQPAVMLGWGWFVVTLLPVSGLVPLGPQAMADRYLYVPGIGLLLAAVWWSADLMAVLSSRARTAVLGVVALACGVISRGQVGFWRDSLTLWQRAANVAPPSATLHLNLGNALLQQKRPAEAEREFVRSLEFEPQNPRPYINLALIAEGRRQPTRALQLLEQAQRLSPHDARIFSNRGSLLHDLGRPQEAEASLRQAVALQPTLVEAHINLGVVLIDRGDLAGAVRSFAEAARLRPGDKATEHNLALARAQLAATRR
ncbi:MAG TPA: tetratricopeptide repeat protein [Opitutaceae bacterium]|nr:tetratricopeptide repeat protein [Opitutaceae bacterium]